MGGSNFADVPSTGRYTYSERAIPYVENEAAYHTGTFNNVTYFDKIDAIKNGDIDGLNALLHNEGISRWDLDDFEELCDSYDSFISKANKELGDSVDATYGIKGQAAEWGDMTGGAGQIVTPFWWKCIRKNRNIKGELSVDKKELISSMLSFKDNIGMWKIVLNQITDADFVIGYGFDNNEKLWKVYQNNERGMKAEWTFENEEEALEKLYKKVKFQYKIIN